MVDNSSFHIHQETVVAPKLGKQIVSLEEFGRIVDRDSFFSVERYATQEFFLLFSKQKSLKDYVPLFLFRPLFHALVTKSTSRFVPKKRKARLPQIII
jgi:hypothetical protein